jgi:hypothetical protein
VQLFEAAEAAAGEMKWSRSQLYCTAVAEYLNRRSSQWITDKLNEVYATEDSSLDPAVHRLQVASLPPDDKW